MNHICKSKESNDLTVYSYGSQRGLESPVAFGRYASSVTVPLYLVVKASNTTTESFPYMTKKVSLRYIRFEFNDVYFDWIDGNHRDQYLSTVLGMKAAESQITFKIESESGTSEITLDKGWKERFLKCINIGMVDIMDEPEPDYLSDQVMKEVLEIYGSKKIPPTCHQFVRYLEFSSTSPHNPFKARPFIIDENVITDDMRIIGILNGKSLVHEFIHLSKKICISKLGSGPVCFHTVHEILTYYSKCLEKTLELALMKYDIE